MVDSKILVDAAKKKWFPKELRDQLDAGAVVSISISGGKDSQALLKSVNLYMKTFYPNNKVFAIHADLGRLEWKETHEFVRRLCAGLNIGLVIVQREKGDLLQRWQERMKLLEGTGKPFWSSAKNRYCTSDLKREPINKYLRKFDNVISVEGIRADESSARAKKEPLTIRTSITTKTRTAYTYYPIFNYSVEDVWATYDCSNELLDKAQIFYSKYKSIPTYWAFHPAYAKGNERLSCSICVLASINDLTNGIIHNPELANTLIQMENESGFTFRHNLSLTDIKNRVNGNDRDR